MYSLPSDIIREICIYLSENDKSNFRLCNSWLYKIINDLSIIARDEYIAEILRCGLEKTYNWILEIDIFNPMLLYCIHNFKIKSIHLFNNSIAVCEDDVYDMCNTLFVYHINKILCTIDDMRINKVYLPIVPNNTTLKHVKELYAHQMNIVLYNDCYNFYPYHYPISNNTAFICYENLLKLHINHLFNNTYIDDPKILKYDFTGCSQLEELFIMEIDELNDRIILPESIKLFISCNSFYNSLNLNKKSINTLEKTVNYCNICYKFYPIDTTCHHKMHNIIDINIILFH